MRKLIEHRRRLLSKEKGSQSDLSKYLTIEALEDEMNVSFSNSGLEYSMDGRSWTSLTDDGTDPISMGEKVYFRGEMTPSSLGIGNFTVNKRFALSGNCLSLLYGDKADKQVVPNFAFRELFYGLNTLRYISEDFLSSEIVSDYAYFRMFADCTSLENSPRLSAQSYGQESCFMMFANCSSLRVAGDIEEAQLSSRSFVSMYFNCTSLLNAPGLSPTTLAGSCYEAMFSGCSSLHTSAYLPATTLAVGCYRSMFEGCLTLERAFDLPAVILEQACYNSMFAGCASLSVPPKIYATTLATYCCGHMFHGCTSLVQAPELLAKTLVTNCYSYMFLDCNKLNYIKALFTTVPSDDYTSSWVDGVASTGTFVKSKNATWNVTGVNGVPNGWTVITE